MPTGNLIRQNRAVTAASESSAARFGLLRPQGKDSCTLQAAWTIQVGRPLDWPDVLGQQVIQARGDFRLALEELSVTRLGFASECRGAASAVGSPCPDMDKTKTVWATMPSLRAPRQHGPGPRCRSTYSAPGTRRSWARTQHAKHGLNMLGAPEGNLWGGGIYYIQHKKV